jgi:hypothetical protein
MSDGQNGFEVEIDLLRSIAQEYDWPDFRPLRYRTVSVGIRALDRLVGAYQLSPDSFALISRKGDRLYLQTSSLGRQPMYPLSARQFVVKHGTTDNFFNRIDQTKFTFALGAHGKAIGLTFNQCGPLSPCAAKRMEGAKAAAVTEEMTAINRRFELQRPATGGEAALRALLEELAMGTTRYAGETPGFAQSLRTIVTLNQQLIKPLGPIVSIEFRRVSPVGIDTYHVVFRNGDGDMQLLLNAKGKVQYALYFPGEQ